jgi:hypothetical protein
MKNLDGVDQRAKRSDLLCCRCMGSGLGETCNVCQDNWMECVCPEQNEQNMGACSACSGSGVSRA